MRVSLGVTRDRPGTARSRPADTPGVGKRAGSLATARGTLRALRARVPTLAPAYRPRRPTETVLYEVVRRHLETFLVHARETYDAPLPRYVEQELRPELRRAAHGEHRGAPGRPRAARCARTPVGAVAAGAEAVLRLRALRASGDFDDYWAFHLREELRRNHVRRYADGRLPDPMRPLRRVK